MIDHGIALPYYRLHVVPAVVALASPTWQREVWLDPDQFEDLDYIVHVLFDGFCDANNPRSWLGQSLRSEEEVELMALLGTAYDAVQDSVDASARDEIYLDSPGLVGRGRRGSPTGPGAGVQRPLRVEQAA
ncbi:SCO4402 family protein [Streptomyces massasporeus]